MIQTIPIEKVLFLDIETVSAEATFDTLSEVTQKLWEKKTATQRRDEITPADYYVSRGGVLAEFGKIICISVGMLDKMGKLKITSFFGHDEPKILREFGEIFNSPRLAEVILCAHNGKEFDFPWIARRFLINGMMPPKPFQTFRKKPWDVPHLDTMELWRFGDYKNFTSLELLAHLFGVPTPKDDIDGSMVGQIYWEEGDLFRIVQYCEKDVLTLANVFRRMRQEDLLSLGDP